LTAHQKFVANDYVCDPYGCANLVQIGPRGLKRRGLAHKCAFWGIVDIAPHFGVKYPQNPNFWGVNMHYQAKRAKY